MGSPLSLFVNDREEKKVLPNCRQVVELLLPGFEAAGIRMTSELLHRCVGIIAVNCISFDLKGQLESNLSACLPVCPSARPPVCSSAHLYVRPSACPSAHPPIFTSACLPARPSVRPSVCPSVYLLVSPITIIESIYLSIRPFIFLSDCLSINTLI